MEVLLLQDISGIGKKNDLIVVGDGFALNALLPRKQALVATPMVRRHYAEQIRLRAEEREREKVRQAGTAAAIHGKRVTISKKATKTGKLYAAVSEKEITKALLEQHNLSVEESAITIADHIKAIGSFTVMLSLGQIQEPLVIDVQAATA